MSPGTKLLLAGALVVFAIALSLITFPMFSDYVADLELTPTVPAPTATPTPPR